MKKLLLIFLLGTIIGCKNDEVTPNQIYGNWYLVGIFDHRMDFMIDYNKLEFSKLPLIQINTESIIAKSNVLEFRSNADFLIENTHPQNLSLGGKIIQNTTNFSYSGQSENDSLFAYGLKNCHSFYIQKANSKFFDLTINFENSNFKYLHLVKVR